MSLAISVLIFACVFGGAMLGVLLRGVLPEHHLSADSKDVVKLGTGLIGMMAALVLGLLVSSGKTSYDTKKDEVTKMAADILLLDRLLSHYGPETAEARQALRGATATAIERIWKNEEPLTTQSALAASYGDVFYDKLHQLTPANDVQRSLVAEARDVCINLGRIRILLFTQAGSSLSFPLIVALVFWLSTIFLSFGLFSPRNATVIGTLLVCALSVAIAMFLILELDQAFDGLIRISDAPMRSVLAHLGR